MFKRYEVIAVGALILVGVGAIALFAQRPPQGEMCKAEAKLCPDGSYVSRTGPQCDFVACPVSTVPVATSTEEGTTTTPRGSGTGERACTMEAKLCPDGSYVGRTGPRCEFPPCSTAIQNGTIRGKVDIGPICPVERVGEPCPVPTEAYTSRTLAVYRSDGVTEVRRSPIASDGTYQFSLPAGSYVLNLLKNGIDHGSGLPHIFTLVKGQTALFNFSIDTGIR